MKKARWFVVMALLLGAFAGCSTPETRIKKSPDVFNALSPADQQLIREGKVSLGFTPEMVKLALGDPDRVMTRTDANGTSESWSYTTYESDDGVYLLRGYYHRYYCWGDPYFPFYTNFPARKEREYFKVVFTGGRVSAIEQQT